MAEAVNEGGGEVMDPFVPVDLAPEASESDENMGSASAWASMLSRRDRLIRSSSGRRGVGIDGGGRRSIVVDAI